MTRRTLAAAITGLVSLALVGAALANEPEDPALVGPEELCEEVATDGGAADAGTDGTDGTSDASDGSAADDTVDGTTDGTDEGTSDGDGCTPAGGTDGDDGGTDGADGTDGTDGTEDDGPSSDEDEVDLEPLEEEADLEEGERPQNHGWYVSEATKTCPESGRERGECISAVAKSDLGKPHAGEDAPEPDGAGQAPAVDEGEDDGPQMSAASPAKGPKGSKGNGGGKGRGGRG